MDKIEENATIDARDNFQALDNWLEKVKERIKRIEFKEDDVLLSGLAVFSAGVLAGTKVPGALRWLTGFVSGAACTYSLVRIGMDLYASSKEPVEEIVIFEDRDALLEALDDYKDFDENATEL